MKKTIRISVQKDPWHDAMEWQEVEAEICEPFGVHRMPVWYGGFSKLYTVSHIRTGLSAACAIRNKARAMRVARALRKVDVNWDFDDPKTVKKFSKKRLAEIRAIRDEGMAA